MSPAALLLALAVATPTLWAALIEGTVSVDVALQRLLLCLLAALVAWTALQRLMDGFASSGRRRMRRADAGLDERPEHERRRQSD